MQGMETWLTRAIKCGVWAQDPGHKAPTSVTLAGDVSKHCLGEGAGWEIPGHGAILRCLPMARQVEHDTMEAGGQDPGHREEGRAMEPVCMKHQQEGTGTSQIVVTAGHEE